jgi:hypothetical protein
VAVAGSGKGALRTTKRQAAIAHSTRVKGARVKGARIKRFASKNRCMIAINPVTTKSELKMMNYRLEPMLWGQGVICQAV